jgi:hypothetical protein
VLLGELLGTAHGAVRALLAGRQDDLGAHDLEHLATLDRHALGEQDLDRVALQAGDRGQRDPGVARRRLEDGLAGEQRAVLLGRFDHRLGDAVLHRPEGVLHLELGEDAHVGTGRQVRHVDDRGVTHEVEHVGVHGANAAERSHCRLHLDRHVVDPHVDGHDLSNLARNRIIPINPMWLVGNLHV